MYIMCVCLFSALQISIIIIIIIIIMDVGVTVITLRDIGVTDDHIEGCR